MVFAHPRHKQFAQRVETTKNHLILTALNHVQGRAYVYTYSGDGRVAEASPVPDNQTVDISTASRTDDRFLFALEGFLSPPAFGLARGGGSLELAKTQKPLFDANNDVVEQLEATSKMARRFLTLLCIAMYAI